MAYNLQGKFYLDKPLTAAQALYINTFAEVRHMKRNPDLLVNIPDRIRENVGLPLGDEGQYYVGSQADFGQDFDHPSVIKPNDPPADCPSLWCQWLWVAEPNYNTIIWDECEKFYYPKEWIEYLCKHFFERWNVNLSGKYLVYEVESRDSKTYLYTIEVVLNQVFTHANDNLDDL